MQLLSTKGRISEVNDQMKFLERQYQVPMLLKGFIFLQKVSCMPNSRLLTVYAMNNVITYYLLDTLKNDSSAGWSDCIWTLLWTRPSS